MPAALYKALGGFATNGVNMTKLESYQLEGSFNATQFYADIEGHPEERNVRLALEELQFFTASLKVLGVYPAHPFRQNADRRLRATRWRYVWRTWLYASACRLVSPRGQPFSVKRTRSAPCGTRVLA